jgi:pilus assembly protein Flp/PilA
LFWGTPPVSGVAQFKTRKGLTISDMGIATGRRDPMHKLKNLAYLLKIWKDSFGQDLIEYALMAGFVAVAAGATFPPLANSICQIFSKITSVLSSANGS